MSKKPNLVIAGDEIWAGINIEDAVETGPLKYAIVIQFSSQDEFNAALKARSLEFDVFRDDENDN